VWEAVYSSRVFYLQEMNARVVPFLFRSAQCSPELEFPTGVHLAFVPREWLAMLAKCTNLLCSASFRNVAEGDLFQLETGPPAHAGGKSSTSGCVPSAE
jgi:hypothetical protein